MIWSMIMTFYLMGDYHDSKDGIGHNFHGINETSTKEDIIVQRASMTSTSITRSCPPVQWEHFCMDILARKCDHYMCEG